MDAFNYLAVLISIILGLGIAQLLTGFGRWIEHRNAFRPFLPAVMWAGILLLIHVQTWWSMFGLRLLGEWTFVRFAVVLLQPITLYLLAIVALPSSSAPSVDLRANYFAQRHWFFGLLAFLIFVSVVKDLVVSGLIPSGANLGFHAGFLALAIAALMTARDGAHHAISVLGGISILAYVGFLFRDLQ
jgi:hypothetical protein